MKPSTFLFSNKFQRTQNNFGLLKKHIIGEFSTGCHYGHRQCPALPSCGDLSYRRGHCWDDRRLFEITDHRKSIFGIFKINSCCHNDVIKWKHFPLYWPFVRGIHRTPHIGQWRGALMFSLICAWINGWVNNGEAGDLQRHRAHYDVTLMNWFWM